MADYDPLLIEGCFAYCRSEWLLSRDKALNTHDDLEGVFRGVPNEIIHQIFHQLDLASLTRLACTSKGMGRVIRNLPELRALLDYAPNSIWDATVTKVSDRLVCSVMYNKLVKPDCDLCSRPGPYLHLLACIRLCDQCMSRNQRYRALSPMKAAEQYSLPLCDVKRLPALVFSRLSTQGCEWLRRKPETNLRIDTTGTRWRFIDQEDISRLCIDTHGSVDEGKRLASEQLTELRSPYRLPTTIGAWLESARRGGDPVACRRLRAHIPPDSDSAYLVSIRFPWFDRSEHCLGRPYLCTLCRDAGEPLRKCYYAGPSHERHMEKHATRSD